jgi:hypothetical protein
MQIDDDKLNALLGRMVAEFGALASAPLVILGDRLGLYKAMAGAGPMTVDGFSDAGATRRSGSMRRPPAASSTTTRARRPTPCRPRRPWCWRTTAARPSWVAASNA